MGRIITGLVLAMGWLLLLFLGPYPLFCLVVTAGSGLALYEFLRMSSQESEHRYTPLCLFIGLLPLVAASLWGGWVMSTTLFLVFLALVLLALALFPSLDNGLEYISRIWFGVFYIGFCSAHLILLRAMPQGVYWLLILTAITVSSDTGAYYVGRMFGTTKLYPALSPGKTRAGAVGGIIGGMLGGLVMAAMVYEDVSLAMIVLLSGFLSAVGIVGDLIESLIKRVSGVKDSGQILPGHGGILDRCDSLLLTAPTLYYVVLWGHAALLK